MAHSVLCTNVYCRYQSVKSLVMEDYHLGKVNIDDGVQEDKLGDQRYEVIVYTFT